MPGKRKTFIMKKLLNLILVFSVCLGGCYSSGRLSSDNNYNYNDREVTYQTFYDQLQPYGNWIDYPGYGYVWQPNEGMNFRPYETNGHWVSTVDGWAWASDYSWGWAPFHYGRWLYEPAIGWAWVPGYDWAPAWVTWGQYNDYYAWAPLAPGINISIGNNWRAPYNYWSFIPRNYIQYSNPHRYVVRNNYNTNIVNNITIINNYNSYDNKDYYHRGPDYREVEQYTHRTINPLAIEAARRPGVERVNQSQFEVYRPAVSPNGVDNHRGPAPARIRTINDVTANGEIRASGMERDNKTGNTYNSDLNQNNTNSGTGNFRNRSFNNGVDGRYNNPDNTTGNAGTGIGSSTTDDRIQRIERFRQNYPQNNTSVPEAPHQQQPQSNGGDRFGAPPMRRYGQVSQSNADRPTTPSQQATEAAEEFRKQRIERIEQFRANNQNGNYNQNPNAGGWQNNRNDERIRNVERIQNAPQQNNNPFRGQPNMPSGEQRAIQARPAASERNAQIPGIPNVPQRPDRRAQ